MSEGLSKELCDLDVHDRLNLLLGDAMAAGCTPIEVHVDMVRRCDLFKSKSAARWQALTHTSAGTLLWRGLLVRVLAAPIWSRGISDSALSGAPYGGEHPFCLAILAHRPSGRHAYFDDPETHEAYT